VGDRGWPLESGRRRLGIVCQPGAHRRPRGTEGTLPGRVSLMRNVATPMRSRRRFQPGKPTVRNAQSSAGAGRPNKRMPVAERQQETGSRRSDTSVGGLRITDRIGADAPT